MIVNGLRRCGWQCSGSGQWSGVAVRWPVCSACRLPVEWLEDEREAVCNQDTVLTTVERGTLGHVIWSLLGVGRAEVWLCCESLDTCWSVSKYGLIFGCGAHSHYFDVFMASACLEILERCCKVCPIRSIFMLCPFVRLSNTTCKPLHPHTWSPHESGLRPWKPLISNMRRTIAAKQCTTHSK